MHRELRISTDPLDSGTGAAALSSTAGAVLVFLGVVRESEDGVAIDGIDYEAFMVGLGFELGLTPGVLPLQGAIRPSVEYVFVDNADLFRVNGDLIGRFSPPAAPVSPYAKAGVAIEFFSVDDCPVDDCSNTEVGINLGGGVLLNSFFVEGTLGLLDISDFRITAGYRF